MTDCKRNWLNQSNVPGVSETTGGISTTQESLQVGMTREGAAGCEYCNDTYEQIPLFHENSYEPYTCMQSYVRIAGRTDGKWQIEIELWQGGNAYADFEINYCPKRGRKLEAEE
jgi:hypothetical protein